MNTDAQLIGAAAEAFLRLGAASVTVAEGPGHHRDTELLVYETGLADQLLHRKISFVDLNRDELVKTKLQANYSGLGHLWLPRTVLASDFIVSMPKVKTHHWTGVTLSMKNMFGIVPGSRYGWPKNVLHWAGIHESILDICATVRPHFVIADGIVAMEGDGPLNGTAKKAPTHFAERRPRRRRLRSRDSWDRNHATSSISKKPAVSLAIIKASFCRSARPSADTDPDVARERKS